MNEPSIPLKQVAKTKNQIKGTRLRRNETRTCFSSLIDNIFISDGSLIESSSGLDDGPEYGGPLKFSA